MRPRCLGRVWRLRVVRGTGPAAHPAYDYAPRNPATCQDPDLAVAWRDMVASQIPIPRTPFRRCTLTEQYGAPMFGVQRCYALLEYCGIDGSSVNCVTSFRAGQSTCNKQEGNGCCMTPSIAVHLDTWNGGA